MSWCPIFVIYAPGNRRRSLFSSCVECFMLHIYWLLVTGLVVLQSWFRCGSRGKNVPLLGTPLDVHVLDEGCHLTVRKFHTSTSKHVNVARSLMGVTCDLPFKSQWLLHVPPGLTFTNHTFCPHSLLMCFVWSSEQTAVISLYSIN